MYIITIFISTFSLCMRENLIETGVKILKVMCNSAKKWQW